MNLAGWMLKPAGWSFRVNIPETPRCVICVAPHTSNWDFVVGELAIRSAGMRASFLMKDTWFFFPVGHLMRALGGIPVKQGTHTNVTDSVVNAFQRSERLWVAVTPEGTRSRNPHWHKGFLHIAREAQVPIVLAYIDYAQRVACIDKIFTPGGDVEADLVAIKEYYSQRVGRYPQKFTTGL
ncbi:MAG: 1-acyl-sn-glycerol-3-phosphate acyltransferase [Muribaculaceae bacterium]|nr:1-acyl-sn-glycerol-3-phosphate acyltransferase [Muribaculaceae bacterium]